jgi:hypothetical protein
LEDFIEQKKRGIPTKLKGRRAKSISKIQDTYRHSEEAEIKARTRSEILAGYILEEQMTEDEITTAKAILEDYQRFHGMNMSGIDTIGILPYKKYLKNIKGLNDEVIENTVRLFLDYLRLNT